MQVHRLFLISSRGLTFTSLPLGVNFGVTSSHIRHYAVKAATTGVPSLGKALGKKGMGKLGKAGGPSLEKKILPVETDSNRLVTHLCGSCITNTGEDIKLKEDSEYPDWLWKINTGKPLPLRELDPDTEYYWKRVKRMAMTRSLQLQKLKKF